MTRRRQIPRIIVSLAALMALTGCSSTQVTDGDLTAGVWAMEAGGETYCWELWAEGDGFGGVVHTVRGKRKETELPIDQVIWTPPELVLHMNATGTSYRGTVDFGKGLITGHVHHGDEQGPQMDLRLTDPADIPGLRARPADGPAYTYTRPATADDGWLTAHCEEADLSPDAVADLVNAIGRGEAGVVHSLLMVAGGRLVIEEYFHGYTSDDLHRLASVTKSVSSLLVGLAIDGGELPGVDTPLLDSFPDLHPADDPSWPAQTLHHLLSMSMGLDWGENDPHATGPKFFQYILNRPILHDPGTHWAYHSANVNLVAGVLKQATGQHADVFCEERLLRPLGITAYDWDYMATDGYSLMDGSLQLRPRDMAKLGMLLRDGGRWHGEQVVSADWIRRSITPHIETDGPEHYGYLWWLGETSTSSGPQPVIFANGRGSQFIAWLPQSDVILVTTGGNEDNGKHFALLGLIGGVL